VTEPEACLSLPGQQAGITRPAVVTVTGTDMQGYPVAVTVMACSPAASSTRPTTCAAPST
jgi:peptide deformylase